MKTLFSAILLATAAVALLAAGCSPAASEPLCEHCPVRKTCLDDSCQCDTSTFVTLNPTWCITKGGYVALMDGDWHCLDTTILMFWEKPVPNGPTPGQMGLKFAVETRAAGGFSTMSYHPLPDGDSVNFMFAYAKRFYPCTEIDLKDCFLLLGGKFVHPDTIRGTFRLMCNSSNPLDNDSLHVMFVKHN